MTFEVEDFSAHSALAQLMLSSRNVRDQPAFRAAGAARASLLERTVSIEVSRRHRLSYQSRFRSTWFRLFGSNLGVSSPDERAEPARALAAQPPSPSPNHVRLRPHTPQQIKHPSIDTTPVASIVLPRRRRVLRIDFRSRDVEAMSR